MWFLIGLSLGTILGIGFMAILSAGRCSDCQFEHLAEKIIENEILGKKEENTDEICSSE